MFRIGVSAIARDPESEKNKITTRMLKKAANYTDPSELGQAHSLPR
jgi:hypothetical protein